MKEESENDLMKDDTSEDEEELSGEDEDSDDEDLDDDDEGMDESGHEEDSDENEGDVESEDEGDDDKSGWADAMAKVLNTGKGSEKAPGLLSKAKKDKAPDDDDESESKKKKREPLSVRREKKKAEADLCRSRPDVVLDRNKEKRLTRLATSGVVKLFNAVRGQQKTLKSELNRAGRSERKREKVFKSVDKDKFMDVLDKAKKSDNSNQEHEEVEEEESSWKILRDDYMMGAKMKDWDRDSD